MGKLGHKVTLIAPRGSARPPKGRLFETVDARQNFADEEPAFNMYRKLLDSFDVVIDDSHSKFTYLHKQSSDKVRIMGVLHTHPTYRTSPRYKNGSFMKANFTAVSASHAMRYSGIFGIPILTTYNGIDMRRYKFQKDKGNRFLWVGRFEKFKGAHMAIYACKALGLPLDLVGKHSDTDQAYFQQQMASVKDVSNITIHGEISDDRLIEFYRNARAVLVPCLWEEPLGLVQLEAQACGTPVISTTMGAIPETIHHGKTGFLCKDLEEMGEYMSQVDSINPRDCRDYIKGKFSKEVMARRYSDLCHRIVSGDEW